MAFARLIRNLLRDKAIGKRVVPIVPDEARTFGMDALFKEFEIYAPFGQTYDPVDKELLLSYTESTDGQILEEGITEAGSMCIVHRRRHGRARRGAQPMIPFFIFYSMFGFQRVGDLAWAAGDSGARGFLLGATAGRTTLNGEGLQHQDGHSLLLASTVPNVAAYDPAFAYEVANIIQDGIVRMFGPEDRDEFFYITLYNENYAMPAKPEGVEDGIRRGLYRFAEAPAGPSRNATVLFSGSASQAALAARDALAADHDVAAELWSATSYKALREDAMAVERSNRLHPSRAAEVPYVTAALTDAAGPVVAVTDFMKAVPDQIARWVPVHYTTLGTDGFGRSDTREALRRHFEVDAGHIVVAVLSALAAQGDAKPAEVAAAIEKYGIDPDAADPRLA